MKKAPKYGVGTEVAYTDKDGNECTASVRKIVEIGRGCFQYLLDCGDGMKRMPEAKITETRAINE